MKLKIKILNEVVRECYTNNGHFHEGDAGLDVYNTEAVDINSGGFVLLHFGIALEPEDGRAFYLMPRGSISKTPLRMSNSIGLIDGGYRGELIAPVDNIKAYDYSVEPKARLFQIVAMDGSPIEYEIVDELSETTRGSGRLGSTGK